MVNLRPFRRPLVITAAVIAGDVGGRLAFDFEMSRVLVLEAVLFGAAAFLLVWAAGRDKTHSSTARRIDLWLAFVLALGSVRAGLWSAGVPVEVVNVIVLGVGVSAAIGYGLWRRARRRPG